ncbi:MAG TPA: tRNA (N6-threonylcarbamoyladenosine(37)-N6)-methyltransferase TrmO [Candidatus Faecivivens stercoripullorum]|uniref:tRNA (N6-threonylcarbamoyladenosine(37)-N6)-methyltransferase TrmO n=1 Tax=Candidatus Faecivivens stercoripullorum TaxID=2840805 RepID=A0A9D1H660_9FIRM|nr:tRNA (N6-threonylcarbamoyladenosine(37)-N6)-methyltransferase TrmO [Candidatus Faecivivens stercoripullorum]
MKVIARIRSDFPTKFGIPRQSGIVPVVSTIVFEPEYRVDEALRGIEGYSHLWLIWEFSQAVREDWSPTVRPPRLGGNTRMGVFATRSPFRPNSIGLSSVKLVGMEKTEEGTVLLVEGADLCDGTPILDIKPYLPFTDSHPDAVGGFSDPVREKELRVEISPELLEKVPENKRDALQKVLAHDPRPSYQHDPERVYGMAFAGMEVKFRVDGDLLTVAAVESTD